MSNNLPLDPFRHLYTGTSRQFSVSSENYLFFSGTDYLGISQNDSFKNLYIDGIHQWGFNNGTSRNNNVQLDIYPFAENYIANQFGAAASIVTSSGYLSAQLVVQNIVKEKNILFSPQTHPAIWLNGKPSVKETDFNEWKKSTILKINESSENRFVVISNAVDPQTPEILDFQEFNQIDDSKNIILIIDDSHGIGFTRNEGKGVFQTLPQKNNITNIVVASMAKGLGIRAGVILSDENTIQQLKKTSMYIGASPPSPASLHAFVNAKDIYHYALKNLISNNKHFSSLLESPLQYINELPIYVSANQNLFQQLKEKNILISSFAYPGINDPLLNRIIINAAHTKEDIQYLLDVLHQ